MATIRIYKVAEVLGIPSQEVIALLRKQHGIEAKSASSTIEEIVARQFAERIANERNLELPGGQQLFAKKPSVRRGGKRAVAKPEVVKPPKLKLGPPRLIKTAKADREAAAAAAEGVEQTAAGVETVVASGETVPTMVATPEAVTTDGEAVPSVETVVASEETVPAVAAADTIIPEAVTTNGEDATPVETVVVAEKTVTEVTEAPPPVPVKPAPPPTPAPHVASSMTPRPTGRVVPPTLRLRVEKPKQVVKTAAPVKARAAGATPIPQPPLGGPRPLPSQPIRPPVTRQLPARPAVGYRPPPRPHHRPGGRRSAYRRVRTQTPVEATPPPPITRTITLAEGMTAKDLADKLEVRAKDVLKKLIDKRLMMTINTTLDPETATMIAREFGADVTMRTFEEEIVVIDAEDTKPEDLITRAPVVTVMGHVDHGKTTLLDAIRETKVAEKEAGGITQHIGAYSVPVKDRRIVFLDTPGHEAFTLMRARGAKVTDVVVLVVAADDGVMPQTQEAIDHAREAKVPIIVAINKTDKADANLDRVKQELAERDLTPEDWGGTTVTVPVSAKKRENLDLLLEMILLVTEMGDHKANPTRAAAGTVLEANVDRGRGPVATVLIQDGTLRIGDNFIAGGVVGRVRALIDDRLQQVKYVGPSNPVEVLGLTGLPQPGDAFQAVAAAAKARQIAALRQNQAKEKALGGRGQPLTLESLQQQLAEGEAKELPIVIKADVQGSAEVLADSLAKLGDERVKIRIIHTGVGAISESNVLLASTSNAIIIGFNVRPDRNAVTVADREGIDIRQHSVIYNVTDEVKKAMAGLLEPTIKEQQLGAAEIRQTFKVPKFGTAAGCMVTDGTLTRAGDAQARIVRDGVVIHEGRIGSLRRFKDDVSDVKAGSECGIAFERFADLKIGDVIESFTVEKVAATV